MSDIDLIARQAAVMRARMAAKPVPVRPMPPSPKGTRVDASGLVAAFIEDRTYDTDGPTKPEGGERPKVDLGNVNTMADIRRVVICEQPEEFIRTTRSAAVQGKSWRNIGMGDVEVSPATGDSSEPTRDRIVGSGEEMRTEPAPRASRVPPAPQPPAGPTPTTARPFAPPGPSAPRNEMQSRMLDAIRSQRRQNIDLMDE